MLDLILSWAAEAFADLLNLVIGLILPVFGFNFDSFARAFPYAATAYEIFQHVGLSIALLITGWHLIPFLMTWFGIQANQLKSTPLRQLFQCALAVVMIYYGNYFLEGIINIAQYPFNALLYAENDPSWSILQFDIGTITSALNDLFARTSVLLYLILLLLIGFNLIKVLLEAVERYVVLFVLIYLSPLAACALASEETSGIYKRFFTMFMSQCLLLLLNVWTMKMAISMFSSLGANNIPALGLLMGYAFLRIALRMDSYLNQLGLNAAVTGAGLGMELMAAGATMLGGLRGLAGIGSAAGSASTAGSPVLGLRDKIAGSVRRWNPTSAAGAIGEATLKGIGATAKGAVAAGVHAYRSGGISIAQAASNATSSFKDNVGGNVASSVTSSDNLFTRLRFGGQTVNATKDFASGVSKPPADGSLYNENQTLVASNAHSAAKVMTGFEAEGYTTSEPKTVSAVMEGIGARKASPELQKFIDVGTGADSMVTASPLEYRMDKNGIHASYIRNGSKEMMDLRNESQFRALSANDQKMYQQFKSSSGDKYYYQTASKRIPSKKENDDKKPDPKPEPKPAPESA